MLRALALCLAVLPALILSAVRPGAAQAGTGDYAALRERAEALHAEGAYARARELYEGARALDLPPAEARWVAFRLADCRWRALAGTHQTDPTELEAARAALEELGDATLREEERDRVWAEARESLGDYHWHAQRSDWGAALGHYAAALDWWAASSDLELARRRYLDLVWAMTEAPWARGGDQVGTWASSVPEERLEDAVRIAREPRDRARAHYLLGLALQSRGHDPRSARRVQEELEAALEGGPDEPWYDDALFALAQWNENAGRVVRGADGRVGFEPDRARALELYRRLLAEFDEGESAYVDRARRHVHALVEPSVGLAVPHVYRPGAPVAIGVTWRNVATVDFELHAVDLTRQVRFGGDGENVWSWLPGLDLSTRAPLARFSRPTGDRGDHAPGTLELELGAAVPELARGAYVLVARAGGQEARELVLVSDAALVLKSSVRQSLAWVCDAESGAPLPGATVVLWSAERRERGWIWSRDEAVTDEQGVAVLPRGRGERSRLFAAARLGERQAFALGSVWSGSGTGERWQLYAVTDRPAYRPEDTARWKLTARVHDGERYATPAGETVTLRLVDPRGTEVRSEELTLNAFGSAHGELELSARMPLGEYRLEVHARGRQVGGATLFRLEEYRLPEFEVTVTPPRDADGEPVAPRLGEPVEVTVDARYYDGAPVAGAAVEVVVTQRAFVSTWRPERPYPWYYARPGDFGWRGGQVVEQRTLRTDAEGRARLAFDTPASGTGDLEYTVEARVTDAARREVAGSGSVRVTGQGYYVHAEPAHRVHRPGDEVRVDFRTLDANDRGVARAARVRVARLVYRERWRTPTGREVGEEELRRLALPGDATPPPGWTCVFRGHEEEELLVRPVASDDEGRARFAFTAPRAGQFRVAWLGSDEAGVPVEAAADVWVGDATTTDLGARWGALRLVVDRDTFRAGETAPVMVSAPSSGATVLLCVEAEELLSWQVLRLEGTVALVRLEIDERHVPNAYLDATAISGGELLRAVEEIVVPPEEQFLEVGAELERDEHRPGDTGRLTITARGPDGEPVAAEVSLGVVDASVYAIQADYAPDPREALYGEKRGDGVTELSIFNWRPFSPRPGAQTEGSVRREDELRNGEEGLRELGYAGDESDYFLGEGVRAGAARESVAKLSLGLPAAPAEAVPGGGAEIVVRSDFRATALWLPELVTGPDGTATVDVPFPDSLTRWRVTARAFTESARVGQATSTVRTALPLTARLATPRFLVAGDVATIAGLVQNLTDEEREVDATLAVEGLALEAGAEAAQRLVLAPRGEGRFEWTVAAREPGSARLRLEVRGGDLSDALERRLPVEPHGIEKLLAVTGVVRGEERAFVLDLPRERRPESTEVVVHVTPSLAVALVDALPYLIDYPYGCTEQTLSRFLPAAIVARTLERLGVDPAELEGRVFGGVEAEHAAATHPRGSRPYADLDAVTRAGLERLADFQRADGGWGWWKEGDSDAYMSAYVVWGLSIAREAGLDVDEGVLSRGAAWLDGELVDAERAPDLQAWMLHAAARELATRPGGAGAPSRFQTTALENLWDRRDELNAASRALAALAALDLGRRDRAEAFARTLENGVRVERPDVSSVQPGASVGTAEATARWGADGVAGRWSDGAVEATALCLRALLAVDAGHELVDPAIAWLVRNRRGAQWKSTRDTALVVLTLSDVLAREASAGAVAFEVLVNGAPVAGASVAAGELLRAPSRFAVSRARLSDGANEVLVRRTSGAAPLWVAAEARFTSLEEPVTPAGNGLFVRRRHVALVPRATLLRGHVLDRVPLEAGQVVESGTRIETVITLEAENDLEYLVVEDLKPAGLETVGQQSGEPLFLRELTSAGVARRFGAGTAGDGERGEATPGAGRAGDVRRPAPGDGDPDFTGRARWVHQELRDRKVALFVDRLPQGTWEVRYEMRAEVPGRYHGLPAVAGAMYVPELRANGAEAGFEVRPAP